MIYKAGQGKSCPNSVRGRKSQTPARFSTFNTAIYPYGNLQPSAAASRGRALLVLTFNPARLRHAVVRCLCVGRASIRAR
jgi:hypothetical protein